MPHREPFHGLDDPSGQPSAVDGACSSHPARPAPCSQSLSCGISGKRGYGCAGLQVNSQRGSHSRRKLPWGAAKRPGARSDRGQGCDPTGPLAARAGRPRAMELHTCTLSTSPRPVLSPEVALPAGPAQVPCAMASRIRGLLHHRARRARDASPGASQRVMDGIAVGAAPRSGRGGAGHDQRRALVHDPPMPGDTRRGVAARGGTGEHGALRLPVVSPIVSRLAAGLAAAPLARVSACIHAVA
jgi:hypothetical protein